jgi:hypothetical protein
LIDCIHTATVHVVLVHHLWLGHRDGGIVTALLIEGDHDVDTHVIGEKVDQPLILPREAAEVTALPSHPFALR